MRVKPLHPAFRMPEKGTNGAGAFDIFMPESGVVAGTAKKVALGFAAEVPIGHVALVLPRSGTGFKYGLELHNTCGVIDSDYRGEWFASLLTKNGLPFSWGAGERVLQFLVIPVKDVTLELSESLDDTARGIGGLGSTGQ